METLGADSDNPQIHREPIARAHLPDKMDVVFQIHRSRFPAAVVCIAQPYGRIECVTRIIEHHDEIPNIHMLVAVRPFSARDNLIAGCAQFLNLF